MHQFINGDSLTVLRGMESESVNMCVTSPPYYNLRDYGVDGQIGLEKTPEEYIQRLVEIFREVRRVLKEDGTLWLNVGDSYCSSNGYARADVQYQRKGRNNAPANDRDLTYLHESGFKTKDLIGIPWMLAFALRADGWYLRQDIIWAKPNPLPESVKDRCTKSHEYIFLLSKSPKYYFDSDAIQEVAKGFDGRKDTKFKGSPKYAAQKDTGKGIGETHSRPRERWKFKNLAGKGQQTHTMHERRAEGEEDILYPVRNKRDVWFVSTKPCKSAHFATFPKDLIEPCILAGCPKGGTVLDPFAGSGTVAVVSEMNERNSIGIELNEEYIKIAEERVHNEAGYKQITMFDEV